MNSSQEEEEFCSGSMPMTMYMDGFRWSLNSHPQHSYVEDEATANLLAAAQQEERQLPNEPLDLLQLHRQRLQDHINPCLTYLVPAWLLDSAGRFQGAMVFSFLLGFLMEVLSALRNVATRHFQTVLSQRPRSMTIICHHSVLTVIYALQNTLGYILMFMAMSFSVEILLSAVFGFVVGHWFFFEMVPTTTTTKQRSTQRQPPSPTVAGNAAEQPLLASPSAE